MSVHQLKDGRWIVTYWNPENKKYVREYFGRGDLAQQQAHERDDEIKASKPARRCNRQRPSIRFDTLADAYLKHKLAHGMPEPSWKALKWKLLAVILPAFGHHKVYALKVADLDRYVDARRRDGVKMTTIHRELSDIQAILNWAASPERGHITHNPVAGYRKPDRDDEIILPPTDKELSQVLKHAPAHLIRYLFCSYYLGVRPGVSELTYLRFADIDWGMDVVLVRSARKGGPRSRMVPIHPQFKAMLTKWYAQDGPEAEYIITYRGRPVKSVKTAYNTAKKKAGIKRRLRLYDFRHAFATRLLAHGGDLKAVSGFLGHSRPDTTTNIYQHVDMELYRQTIGKLPPIGDGTS